jgi:hypothetical protein
VTAIGRARLKCASIGRRAPNLGRERWVFASAWCLAVIGCLLAFRSPPANVVDVGPLEQSIDLLRIVSTTALAVVLLLGPGLALRALPFGPRLRLGFLPLPGMALLALAGGIAWGVGVLGWIHPRLVVAIVLAPVLAGLPVAFYRGTRDQLLSSEEWRALLLIGGALGIAIARSLWSLDLPGELYAGTIYRTLEAGDRPDSRISFHVVELIANGNPPYGAAATSYFSPYTFSDRGPLAALASAPIVLLSGGHPPAVVGSAAWSPFDPQGFMAYRLAMMTLASTCFLSLWTLVQRLAGRRAAYFAVLLAVTTPFLVHEIWFTWPKLLAASFVLLSALCLIDNRPFVAGVLVGIGYLVHPLALLSLPGLLLIALWPLVGAQLRRPKIRSGLLLLVGAGLGLIGWRLANGSHYTQNGFLSMFTQAGNTNLFKGVPVTLGLWLDDRLISIGNTLIPMRLFLLSAHDQDVNSALQPCFPLCTGGSPGIEHFFFQYWDTVPFGLAIVFFPLLLLGLWRALRRWPWPVTATVIVPFVSFAVYWGGASTGLLREGMHAWVLTLVAVVAVEQHSRQFSWLRNPVLRALLALRAVEVLLVAMLPTVWTLNNVVSTHFWLSDSVAVLVMIGLSGWLGLQMWRAIRSTDKPPSAPGAPVVGSTQSV